MGGMLMSYPELSLVELSCISLDSGCMSIQGELKINQAGLDQSMPKGVLSWDNLFTRLATLRDADVNFSSDFY